MRAIAFLVGLSLATAAHAEQPWSSIARQCGEAAAERMHAETGCAGCAGSWPSAALCAVNSYTRGQIPEGYTKKCIELVWYQRLKANVCNACGNPIDETFFCLQSGR